MAGSIEKRGENTYRLVVSGGKNLDGTRCKKAKTIHGTRKDAKIALAEFITEVNRGLVPEGKSITFEEFFYIWDEKYASKELAPKTYSRYIGILKSRILPYLGSFPLDKIKSTDLMNFYDMLENDTQIKRISKNNGQRTLKPLSPKTILEHHRLISAMLQNAVYWQLLPSNPTRRVKPPKTKKPKMEFFNDDECKVLIQSLMELTGSNLKYKAAILLDIFSGVRRGELIGLEWSDVDFKNGTLILINLLSTYLKIEFLIKILKPKVLIELFQYQIILQMLFLNIKNGMTSKKTYLEINGLNLINYLYKIMENLCIQIQLENGLSLILRN